MSDTQNTIDWQGPLEAFNETSGAVWPVQLIGDTRYVPRDTQPMRISPALPDEAAWFGEDGNHPWSVWRIRNVAQTTRTTDEQLTHYAERCKALVERMAERSPQFFIYNGDADVLNGWIKEARAIVASMVEVDPDKEASEQILKPYEHAWTSNLDETLAAEIALAAIRRGRALERGE